LFSFFGFRSSVGWMCALRTASPDWHSFARWSWSEATAPSAGITCMPGSDPEGAELARALPVLHFHLSSEHATQRP